MIDVITIGDAMITFDDVLAVGVWGSLVLF